MKLADWLRLRDETPDPGARVQPSPYVDVREGARKTSFRVNFRQDGHDLRDTLKGDFKSWKDAQALAEKLIFNAKAAGQPKAVSLVRCETLCDEIVTLKQSKSAATHQQAEIFFRLHIKPFLNDHCPYASELNATVWLKYKNWLRLKDPTVALFNHWKFFVQLARYAYDRGLIPQRLKLEFSEDREDNRARGMVMPDSDFWKLAGVASRVWRDRITIQWFTGMRPGEVRWLRKDRWDQASRTVSLKKEDTKTRQARQFRVTPQVATVLAARMPSDSPYFFPNERDHSKPMDKHLGGWKSALTKAGMAGAGYTPHDLRHSYLTRMFKSAGNPALICYQAGLSLEEAQKTYLHFTAADTQTIADLSGGAE